MKRRKFIKNSTLGTAAAIVVPQIVPSRVLGKYAPSNMIQIGQIGFGRIAMSHDLPETIKHTDMARVVAVSDVDRKRMDLGKKWIQDFYKEMNKGDEYMQVATHQDYRDLLADPTIDAVIISTPDHWHAQPAMEAALSCMDIYLHKPTSLTIEEGRMMSNTIHQTGAVLHLVSQQRSLNPWPQ
ncbi:MAG TPA: Gfo/Idh/MocA family oxidoreductase, partial [Membranihabitans sp.]|nr:Gfo/Idh/MocA family oxidoreductase [Membranihabitans sp.]